MGKGVIPILTALAIALGTATAQPVELTIKGVSIDPAPALSAGRALQLRMSRSYRLLATIDRGGPGELTRWQHFTVRTECVRPNGNKMIGQGRIGVGPHIGWRIYAAYEIYPGEAGAGQCLALRTTVDADHEVQEPDESPASNVFQQRAVILP